MNLSIAVFEFVKVEDVIVDFVRKIIKTVKGWFFEATEENPQAETSEIVDDRAPPALGISVGEDSKISEALS